MFRDESNRVQQKYRVASEKEIDADSDAERTSNFSEHGSSSSKSSPGFQAADKDLPTTVAASNSCLTSTFDIQTYSEPYPALSQALSDIATAFYLTQYTTGSHFDYLPLLCSSSSLDSLLTNVIQAVSIASLSHETRKPELMALARQKYSRSLIEMNRAIQDPRACLQDGTLASVLLLSHFETLASEDSTGVSDVALGHADAKDSPSTSWDRHVQGAVSLVALHPKPKLDSSIRCQLHQHVNAMARYSCIARCTRLPAEVSTLYLPFGIRRDEADPNRQFIVVVDGFTELRACIKEGSLTDPLTIIQRARSLDTSAALVARNLNPSWMYDVVVTTRDMGGVYKNKYHLYSTHRVAQLWNEIRMTRLALNEMILVQSKKARQSHDEEGDVILSLVRSRSIRVIDQMATEICQSTTEFLQKPGSGSSPLSLLTSSTAASSAPKPLIASAYFLIWPLFTAACASSVVDDSLSEFVIERLHFIAREMHIPQARKAALMLEQGIVHEDWLHMLHLF